MLGDEIVLKEKDVQANSLHNVPRAVACGVLWGVRRAKARGRAEDLPTRCCSDLPAPLNVGFYTKTEPARSW